MRSHFHLRTFLGLVIGAKCANIGVFHVQYLVSWAQAGPICFFCHPAGSCGSTRSFQLLRAVPLEGGGYPRRRSRRLHRTDAYPAQGDPARAQGRDLIGSAQTGTGKTAAFALPDPQPASTITSAAKAKAAAAACLCWNPRANWPCRSRRTSRNTRSFSDLRTTAIYGGVGYGKQRDELNRGVDILVATPGRLIDCSNRATLACAGISILVLDEVDRMLDMGFFPAVKRIVEGCPKNRQTLFFSATLPPGDRKPDALGLRPIRRSSRSANAARRRRR